MHEDQIAIIYLLVLYIIGVFLFDDIYFAVDYRSGQYIGPALRDVATGPGE